MRGKEREGKGREGIVGVSRAAVGRRNFIEARTRAGHKSKAIKERRA